MTGWQGVVAAVVPSICVGLLFWFALRAMLNADAKERREAAKLEAAERAARADNDPHAGA